MDISLEIKSTRSLTSEEKSLWTELIAESIFGSVAIDWCEALVDARPPGFEIHYLQVFDGNRPVALVIVHVLRRLDLAGYMGKAARILFDFFGMFGWRPTLVDLAFIEIPLAQTCGILCSSKTEVDAFAVATRARSFIRKEFSYDILCLKSLPHAPGEAAFASLGMLSTDFLARMSLPLEGLSSFPEYVATLRPRVRTAIRSNKRTFLEAGGSIEACENPTDQDFEAIGARYLETCAFHAGRGEMAVPIAYGKEFFSGLFAKAPTEKRRVFLARLHGEIIGFALVVDSGKSLYFTHCGLDYARAIPSRAYFNLYYALIDYAISQSYETVELGTLAYETKKKLGGRPRPTRYYFEVRRPLLSALANFVASNFRTQSGSELSSSVSSDKPK